MTNTNNSTTDNFKLTQYEREYPLAYMLDVLAEGFRPGTSQKARAEIRAKVKNAISVTTSGMMGWTDALGHMAWLAQNNDEANETTIQALSNIVMMQSTFAEIAESLSNLKHCVDNEAGSFVLNSTDIASKELQL